MAEIKPTPRINAELIYYRLDEIKQSIDEIKKDYVTKQEFDDFKLDVHSDMKRKNFATWVNPIIASVSTALVTFLILEYFKTH